MNTKTDRFQRPPRGGHYSETSYIHSSFEPLNKHHVARDKELIAKEVEKGRPLWLHEINKKVPAAAQYEIESAFANNSTLLKTRSYAMKCNNTQQNQTMREESGLHKFMAEASTVPQEGVASYEIKHTQTKKRNPMYSMATAKQHTTFDFGKFHSTLIRM